MGRISKDNCLTSLEYDNITNIFPIIRARFEEYGFTLDYEGSSDEYNEEFLSMVGLFLEHVKSSYLEYKYWTHPYKDCFEDMIKGFETKNCPYKRTGIGRIHTKDCFEDMIKGFETKNCPYKRTGIGSFYLDGKRLC